MEMQEKKPTLLSQEKLNEQLDIITYFLRSVHPSLGAAEGYRPCVELRPINRGPRNYMLSKSLLLWDLSDESVFRLRTFLERHNGKTTCLYYSVFCFDNNADSPAVDENGKKKRDKKISSATALFTDEIVLDFDGVDFDGYIDLVDRFEDLGVYAVWVSTGHGYQAHILLEKSVQDKSVLKRFVYKFRSKGFVCDPKCIDPARVMHLPGTFNNKCFEDESYASERDNPPFCALLQESSRRYSEEFIWEQLSKLETVSPDDEAVLSEPIKEKQPARSKKSSKEEDIVCVRRIEYPHLENYELPDAVAHMLAHTPKGYRNNALAFLIKFFKDQFKMGKNQVYETLCLWAKEACVPEYEKSVFEFDFKRFYYQYGGLGYDPALAQKFGYIDFGTLVELRKKDITIPTGFFAKFKDLDSKSVRLYLGIKMLEHIEEPVTQESLSKLLGITDRALRPTLQDLKKANLIYIKKGNARAKIPNTYRTQRKLSADEGYLTISYNDAKAYVMELFDTGSRGNSELKLYLFMRWKFFSGEIFMSQNNLGNSIGVARNSISDLVYKLQDKHFLRVRKVRRRECFDSCEYTLLR